MKESEKIVSFAAGFAGYPLLEWLWRGHTHWSMAWAGGFALLALYPCAKSKTLRFCLRAALVITAIELLFGILFNLILKANVWDYSKLRGNLWGQICLPFTCLWFLLGIPIRLLCKMIGKLCKDLD